MSRLTSNLVLAAVLGQLVAQLGWIDALFIPLVLAAPPVTGAILASRRVGYAWVAVLWASTGLGMAWSDWIVNREDVAFHLALAVIMPLLAGAGFGPGTLTAIVLFVPVSAWIIHACFGTGRLSYKGLALIFFNGVVFHIILTGPLMLFINGEIGSAALVATQLANAVLFLPKRST